MSRVARQKEDPIFTRAEFVSQLEQKRREYEFTNSPLALFDGYGICRESGLPIPKWILQGFDSMHERLRTVGYRRKALQDKTSRTYSWTVDAAWVLGFSVDRKAGKSDPFVQGSRDYRDLDLAQRVRLLVDGPDSHNPTDACYLVANSLGVGEPLVRRAWKRFDKLARSASIDETRADGELSDGAASALGRIRQQAIRRCQYEGRDPHPDLVHAAEHPWQELFYRPSRGRARTGRRPLSSTS